MKKLTFSILLLAAFAINSWAEDVSGKTIRYRGGTVLSFDSQVTFTNEDSLWGFSATSLGLPYPVTTFGSASNAVTVTARGAAYLLVSATPVSLTNCVGAIAGYVCSADVTVSNSTAATYTNFCTIPNAVYVGANADNQATNAVKIASTKQAFWHIETRGVNRTNVWVTVEQ
jgi:hypothetical protein